MLATWQRLLYGFENLIYHQTIAYRMDYSPNQWLSRYSLNTKMYIVMPGSSQHTSLDSTTDQATYSHTPVCPIRRSPSSSSTSHLRQTANFHQSTSTSTSPHQLHQSTSTSTSLHQVPPVYISFHQSTPRPTQCATKSRPSTNVRAATSPSHPEQKAQCATRPFSSVATANVCWRRNQLPTTSARAAVPSVVSVFRSGRSARERGRSARNARGGGERLRRQSRAILAVVGGLRSMRGGSGMTRTGTWTSGRLKSKPLLDSWRFVRNRKAGWLGSLSGTGLHGEVDIAD
jgi:hypothetical protein